MNIGFVERRLKSLPAFCSGKMGFVVVDGQDP